MALNIKNERTIDAVKRLAARYDTSYTTAIEIAAEQALRTPPASTEQHKQAKARQIARAYHAHSPSGRTLDTDHLYNAAGLYS